MPQWQILIELEFHNKLEFEEFKFLNSGKSLYISETVINCNIFCQIIVLGHFGPKTCRPKTYLNLKTNELEAIFFIF